MMGIRLVDPPRGLARGLASRLGGFADVPRSARNRAICLAAPHPTFHLPLAAVRPGGDFETASMSGWQFFVVAGGKTVAFVERAIGARGPRSAFAAVWRGRAVRCANGSLAKAEENADVIAGDRVLGLLRLSALHVTALWLRDGRGRGDRDLFIPLDPAPRGFPVGGAMGASDFMRHLLRAKKLMMAKEVSGRPREPVNAARNSSPRTDP